MRMKNIILALATPVVGSLVFPSLALAQSAPARADAARGTTTQAPAAAQQIAPAPGEEAPKLPGDADYGVQKIVVRRSNWEPWQAGAFAGMSYSTNPALLPDNGKDDFYFRGGAYVNYTPQITGNWFADIGLSQSFYNYDKLDALDFAQTYASAGVLYATPADAPALIRNTVATLRYRFENLTDVDNLSDDFFTDHSIQLGAQRTFRISRGHRAYVGVSGSWSVDASVDSAARDEYAALFGYRIEWTPEFSTSADVRSAIYDYRDADRLDWNNILSVSAEYKFTEWASLGANFGWIFNSSDESVFDYNSGDIGAMVNLSIRF